MQLNDEDLKMFAGLGISPGTLTMAEVERVDDATAREKFGIRWNGDVSGIVFPYRLKQKRVTARLRRDHPERDAEDKPQNKYISPAGDRRHLYLPPDYEQLLADSSVPLIFVESEKSALAITEWSRRSGRKLLPLATGGCWGWRGTNGIRPTKNGNREPQKGPLPEVSFAADGRPAGILFDVNADSNPDVQQARKALAEQLHKQGAKVLLLKIPATEGVNGPDDYIGIAGDGAFGAVLNQGEPFPSESDAAPGRLPVTDISNAERLVARFSEDVRYVSGRKTWCVWNATHWAANDLMGVSRRMQEVARGIYFEAAKEPNPELRNAMARWAQRSESQSVQMSSIEAARCHVEVKRYADVFDTDPLALNGTTGAADLKKGKSVNAAYPRFYPHRREDYITKVAPVAYRPEAKCPQFDRFLNQTFLGSAALVSYMQRLSGYCLTGLTTEQKWWMFYGPTASGKSTFIKILHGLLGPYALELPENYFLLSKHDSTDFVTANLVGVRLATCIETNEGRRLNVARIKTTTGEDSISAALKYQNYFELKPQCKLVLVTNYPPHVPAGDDALWRRLKVVPFVATVPEDERIPGLADKLLAEESSGILNWAIAGCREWQAAGLKEPPEVTAAISEYRTSEDLIANFLADENYQRNPESRAPAKDVFKDFRDWCVENSIRPGTKTRFTRELHRLGIPLDGRRYYIGISRI
jgi:P4 family phage/plasmid primase-like protien